MTARESQWRRRAKKLITLARDAQFELLAKTIRYSAMMAVLTAEENAALTVRIRAYTTAQKAINTAKRQAKVGAP